MGLISQNLRTAIKSVFVTPAAAKEIETILSDVKSVVDITPSAAVVPVAVTFTAGAPATYAAPSGTLTVALGGTPTVNELLDYCNDLRGNIVSIQAVLHAKGLTL